MKYKTTAPTKLFSLAAGSAYAFKRAQNGLVVICYFGEGAASEGKSCTNSKTSSEDNILKNLFLDKYCYGEQKLKSLL